MKCRSCGAENAEGRKFCTSCGSKLEQKITCPSCGNELEEDAAFCGQCGRKSDFAPKPEKPAEEVAGTSKSESVAGIEDYEEPQPFAFPFKKIFGLVANILAVALGVALLAFVSFLGVKSVTAYGSEVVRKSSVGMLDYLGKIPSLISSLSFIGIAATATFIVTLVLVAVFSILALVAAIKMLRGAKSGYGGKWIASAFVAYVVGATLIKSYFDLPHNVVGGSVTTLRFNGATIAGITVCSTLFAAFIVCLLLTRGKELFDKKVIVDLSFAAAKVVLAGVVIAMIASTAYKIYAGSDTFDQGYLQLVNTIVSLYMTESIFGDAINNGWIASIIILLPVLFSVAVAAFAAIDMRRNSRALFEQGLKPSFVWNIVLVVFAVLLLIVSSVVGGLFATTLTEKANIGYTIAPVGAIVIFVLSLALLGVAIAHALVNEAIRTGGKGRAKKAEPKTGDEVC